MTGSFKIFLLVAEEMSISKAAERAFVTQQCVSDHIKRLEEAYGITLFERRPKLALTEAGLVMLNTLSHIRILENNLEDQLGEISHGTSGTLTIGINSTRASIILPDILPLYRTQFPNVILKFVMDDTRRLEEKLVKGEVDMFVGVNTHANEKFEPIPMGMDNLHVIVSHNLMRNHIQNLTDEVVVRMKQGVSLAEFGSFPFVANDANCTLHDIVIQYVDRHNIHLKWLYHTSDYDTQVSLCASDLAVAICPTMVLMKVMDYNQKHGGEHIHAFPLEGENDLKVDLIYHKDVHQPLYARKFAELLKESVTRAAEILNRYGY